MAIEKSILGEAFVGVCESVAVGDVEREEGDQSCCGRQQTFFDSSNNCFGSACAFRPQHVPKKAH